MRRWLYDLGFLAFGVASLPHFFARLRQAEDPRRLIRERLGFLPEGIQRDFYSCRPTWIHCVSVGEVLAVEKLVQLFRERKPHQPLVLTTVTPTGQALAKAWEGSGLKVFYFPFDVSGAVRRFFDTLQPAALFLVETEIWPNLLEEARRRRIPVGLVNGRLSERSLRWFRRFKPIFQSVFSKIDFFLVQTPRDRERWLKLGVDPERVHVTGNMKLDAFELDGSWKKNRELLREDWGLARQDKVLVGGSTHQGEEEVLLRVFRRLREEGFPVKLVLAPRHIERSEKIVQLVKRQGLVPVRASRGPHSFDDVLVLDQLGQLRRLYAAADAVFVGGSLVRHGGQNPIEPAACRRPILHGPWIFNFQDLYDQLDREGGSLRIQGEEELRMALRRVLSSDRESEYLGNRAFEILHQLQGASERNFTWIGEHYGLDQKLFSAAC